MRSEKRQRQLEKMWAAGSTPEANRKRSETLKRHWAANPEQKDRCVSVLRRPDVALKAHMAQRVPLEQRFFAKVQKDEPTGCWLWTGSKNALGYGFISDHCGEGHKRRATHVSLQIAGRPRPDPKLYALHSCDNPQCVNPDHLRWGSAKDNAADMMLRGRLNASGLKGAK